MRFTADVYIENAEWNGDTFDLFAGVSCEVRDDSFDHAFGTEIVSPYPDENNIYVESFKTSNGLELTDEQVMEIINEQFDGEYKWN